MSPTCHGAYRAVVIASCVALLCMHLVVPVAANSQSAPVKVGGEVTVSSFAGDVPQWYVDAVRRPDGKYIAVWSSYQQETEYDVYMQLFNSDRSKSGGEVRVNTNTQGRQFIGRVAAAPDNSFVVVWFSGDVYYQRFDSSGAKIGGEALVSAGTTAFKDYVDVTYLTNGDVVFSWRDASQNPIIKTFFRRFNSAFVPLSGDVSVNDSPTQISQQWARIASLSGGGFVIVYFGMSTDGDHHDVYGQIFAADGTKRGAAIRMNLHTVDSQRLPHAAGLPDGGFIATWDSKGQDGDNYGVIAQHFSAAGLRIGAPFVVNTHTARQQERPKVTTFKDNSFAITWYGYLDNNDRDVSLQYFDAAHNKVGAQILVNTRTDNKQHTPGIAANWVDGDFGVFYSSKHYVGPTSDDDVVAQWFQADLLPVVTVPRTCTSACLQYFCTEGALIDIAVTGVVSDSVWGSAFFTDDSSVASAAVFAGLLADGETKTLTVKCSGAKPSFTSGSAHGVTTQAFSSPWPSTFTFDLGGETQAPPAPSPRRCYHEPCAHGKCTVPGTSFDIAVEGTVSNNVWGSASFSDDSWVGSAAVHEGLVEAGAVGGVTVTCVGARESLTGSAKNGVVSNSYGPWQFTYVLSPAPFVSTPIMDNVCGGACLNGRCPENSVFFLRVSGTTHGYLWGSARYSDDTTVSSAAVHAGLVTNDAVAVVKATCTGAQTAFVGTTAHGVTTESYGAWPSSFTLTEGTGMPTLVCSAGEQCLKDKCAVAGRVIKVSVTGSSHAATQFWGTSRFTDDSPLSHAAVHSGLVVDGQTAVLFATCHGPHDSFAGTQAHGTTSSPWAAYWPGSFTLSSTL